MLKASLCCAALCRLEDRLLLLLLLLLLLFVQDDADDVALVLLHVLHQTLLARGLEAADAAAEEQHAVLHAWAVPSGLGARGRGRGRLGALGEGGRRVRRLWRCGALRLDARRQLGQFDGVGYRLARR